MNKMLFCLVTILIVLPGLVEAQKEPTTATEYVTRGGTFLQNGEFDKAIADFNSALVKDPANYAAFCYRGICYYQKKLYNDALADLNASILNNGKFYFAYHIRGAIYQEQGNYDKAIADYTQSISLSPETNDSRIARGQLYALKRDFENALKDCNEAIAKQPKEASAYAARAWVYIKKEDNYSALSDLNQAILTNPTDFTALSNRGDLYYTLGDYDKAIADGKEAIKHATVFDNIGLAYINIITAYVRKLQFEVAAMYYKEYNEKKLSSFVDEDAKFYKHYLATISEQIPQNNYKGALENLDKALSEYSVEVTTPGDKKNEYIATLVLKAYILEQLNNNNEAKDVYHQALVVNPNQPDIKAALARIEKNVTLVKTADKIPPTIELLSPQASRGLDIVASKTETQVIGRAKDVSGIASIVVNGVKAKSEDDGLFFSAVQLSPGANNITITATDQQGNASTKTFTIQGKVIAQQKEVANDIVPVVNNTSTPQYHAIIIAAKDYNDPSIPDLDNPVKDAAELKSILETQYTFNAKNIKTLYNKNKDDIMQTIIQTSNSLSENDNLLIFYAGHGIAEKDKFGDVDGYWIPSSAKKGLVSTYISADDIKKALKRSDSKHVLVIADACFSGAFTRALSSDASAGIQKQYNVASRKIMASGNMEPVPDNSRFIFYLKKNLRENKEKYLTAKKLFDSFYEAILNNSDTSPQYAAIKNIGDEGGEFVFIKK